jgi:formylglycine-generating enzyme required for sulfatase activity
MAEVKRQRSLERLLKDLSDRRRDMDDMPHLSPIVVQETIEPPYLQIVCARLWELNAGDKNQRLRLASYERVECAEGILKSFLDNVLADFSQAEKQLLSKAFDYLATQRGIKMAYPVDVLAKILRVKEQKLGTVLEKLADVRVLRSQQRDGGMWYELYHDMFSSSIETWNNAWKKQQLRRRQIIAAPLVIIFILLSDSFFWSLRNGLPLNYMLMQQKFRLMNWGLLPEPLPEVIDIPTPKGEFRVGEYDKSFGEMANKSLNQAGQHNFLNFGYPNTSATVQNSFAFGKYEVTYEQYDYYVWQQDKDNPPVYPGNAPNENKRGLRAVVNVSWNDANAYLNWLSEKTGRNYRLPTEVEWEYAARAGTYTPYWWGNETEQAHANCNGCGSQWDNKFIAPVGSFPPNSFGLYDTAGNVWEWTCSNWQEEFDGSETRCAIDDQSSRVVRGGSWDNSSDFMRSSVRAKYSSSSRLNNVGFRVVLAKKSR